MTGGKGFMSHYSHVNSENWFKVDPRSINSTHFLMKRDDKKEEEIRELINEALEVAKNNSNYDRPFKTTEAQKNWSVGTLLLFKSIAEKIYGGHVTDWVEQCLEWAQKLEAGMSWNELCAKIDNTKYYKVVAWKRGQYRLIGGCTTSRKYYTPTHIGETVGLNQKLRNAVPKITRY